jgi:hypothetical protein
VHRAYPSSKTLLVSKNREPTGGSVDTCAAGQLRGVNSVSVNLTTETAAVLFDQHLIGVRDIITAINDVSLLRASTALSV